MLTFSTVAQVFCTCSPASLVLEFTLTCWPVPALVCAEIVNLYVVQIFNPLITTELWSDFTLSETTDWLWWMVYPTIFPLGKAGGFHDNFTLVLLTGVAWKAPGGPGTAEGIPQHYGHHYNPMQMSLILKNAKTRWQTTEDFIFDSLVNWRKYPLLTASEHN